MLKIEELREIIKIIDESSIHEFTYENDGSKITLKKSNRNINETLTGSANNVKNHPTEELLKEETTIETTPIAESSNGGVDYDYEIVSPMVGTLYRAPSPESEPYVTIGSKVSNDSIVCIVEAMKLFNEIEAEVNGEIVEVLVENGELVEYGQPLFRVKTL